MSTQFEKPYGYDVSSVDIAENTMSTVSTQPYVAFLEGIFRPHYASITARSPAKMSTQFEKPFPVGTL